MKKYLLMSIAALLLLLPGCKGNDSASSEELLKSVPSSASMVTVANLQNLLEKSGCKVSDGSVTPSPGIVNALQTCNVNDKKWYFLKMLMNNESGIDPSVTIFFTDGYTTYNSGLLKSTDSFIKAVEKEMGEKFTEQDGVQVCGTVAVKDNRYWLVLSGRSEIDASEVRKYVSLSETQSFLSSDYSKPLLEIKSDVEGWGDLGGLMNVADLSFSQNAQAKMLIEMCFKDAGFVTYTMNFEKDEAEASVRVLDSKGKGAKFLLPAQALDMAAIETLGDKCASVVAVSIPQKLIKKIKEQLDSQPLFKIYLEALSPIDGTVAVIAGEDNKDYNLVAQTDGENTSDLMKMLGSLGTTSKEGKMIYVKKGIVTGKAPLPELAAPLKGAYAGVSTTATSSHMKGVKSVSMTLVPSDGSVGLKLKAFGDDPKVNLLETIVKESCAKAAH